MHEHRDWPNFTWDNGAIAEKLAQVRYRQGLLLGRMAAVGFDLKQEANLGMLTRDVIKSSAIEGEQLNPEMVRSSIARRLGMDVAGLPTASRHVEGIVEMMMDATQNFSAPLTRRRLFGWHAALFPTGHSGLRPIASGAWRTDEAGAMQVVSGPIGREQVHFEAPAAGRVPTEMKAFIAWFDAAQKLDPILKAGIAHLWFVTIHPFEDGNGRIARAIGDMALARADGTKDRFYSLSGQIESERKAYYDQLERQQRATTEITGWLEWFLACLGHAIDSAEKTLGNVLFKERLWAHANRAPVNERQRLVLNRMLEDGFKGYINTSKYATLAKCSTDTALRDIQELKVRGVFVQNPGGGRSTSYRLPDNAPTD